MEQKQRPDETGKTERKPISVEEANSRAYQIGLQSDCIIKLEKRAGENRYQRHFKASSASALLNGMAVLIRDYAETLNLSVVEVLSVLAVVLTMPTIQEKTENRRTSDMEQQFFTIQIERRETRMERLERRKRETRKSIFAAVLAVLAAAALFAALAATEPVIVVTKEAEQGLQPVVLIVPEAEV